MKRPSWWQHRGLIARLLWPLGWLYQTVTACRISQAPQTQLSVPVICIGNVTAGGGGKTPMVGWLAKQLQSHGQSPHILCRGYKAAVKRPVRVEKNHTAAKVGDEALLHAAIAPCWVYANRAEAAVCAVEAGATHVLLDDGLQHASLKQDVRIVMMKGQQALGNKYGIPAGPLRESLSHALGRVDAVVTVDDATCYDEQLPHFVAETALDTSALDASTPYVAFAGIAEPHRFFEALEAAGIKLTKTTALADHAALSDAQLEAMAKAGPLLCTQKDWVRLSLEWQTRVAAVPLDFTLKDADSFLAWLNAQI